MWCGCGTHYLGVWLVGGAFVPEGPSKKLAPSVQEPDPDTSDSETEGAAPKPKKAKYAGSFQYKTKFSKDWQKKYPHLEILIALDVPCALRI